MFRKVPGLGSPEKEGGGKNNKLLAAITVTVVCLVMAATIALITVTVGDIKSISFHVTW